MKELYAEASKLAGRDVEVDQTKDGEFIVLFLQFEKSPPPKGHTEQEALENFIEYMLNKKGEGDNLDPENTKENDDDDRDRSIPERD